MVDIDQMVPADHMLRKIEKIMDYDWLYERLSPYYCHDNGRPGTDPVVPIKVVLLQHLYGIPSLRQTQERVNDTVSYRWFLGYSLLDKIPHFATASYAFCQRFPAELPAEIFSHILNKAINNRALYSECGMFVKGEHERQFAYEAHTACDKKGLVLAVEVTAGNVNNSVAWDAVYDTVTERFPEATHIVMDAGDKTPWIMKRYWRTAGSLFSLIHGARRQKDISSHGIINTMR